MTATRHPAVKSSKASIPFYRRSWCITLGLMLVYCLISLAAYWPILPFDAHRLAGSVPADPLLFVWFLRWVPFAIAHHHNILFTNYINVPYGANLAQNTPMPLLGLLVAPLTLLISPIASFNLLAWAAFPVSAAAMFYVVRRFGGSQLVAFVAGLLYGFSPYMIGQGAGHVMLSFVPLLPLMLLVVWELLVRQRSRPRRAGALLALLIVAQFFIDPEVIAIMGIVVFFGVLLGLLMQRGIFTKTRMVYAARGLAVTAVFSGVALCYPIWFMLAGPQHFVGPNFQVSNPYRSDAAGLISPTLNEKFIPSSFRVFAGYVAAGDYVEIGDYMGIVLLLTICVATVHWRRNRWLVFSSILALLCWIMSLGPQLVVNGLVTHIPLPFGLIDRLPLLQDILPSRISLAEWLFVTVTVALIITEFQKSWSAAQHRLSSLRKGFILGGALLLSGVIVVSLIPRWPYTSIPTSVPRLFTHNSQAIAANSIVLTYPFAIFPNDQAMLWQASSGMRFKLVGAYIQNRSAAGTQSAWPPLLAPKALESWLAYEQQPQETDWPQDATVSSATITSFIQRYHVGVIIVDPTMVHAKDVAKQFSLALGPPRVTGGVLLWTGLK